MGLFRACVTVIGLMGAAFAIQAQPINPIEAYAASGTNVLVADIADGRLSGFGVLLNEETVDGPMLSNRFLRYKGLQIWLVCARDGPGEWRLAQVQITEGGPPTQFGIAPGASRQAVERVLGRPTHAKGNRSFYQAESTQVTFEFRGSTVRKIVWDLHAE